MPTPWIDPEQDATAEGVIRYRYRLTSAPLDAPVDTFAAIHAKGLADGWLGRDPERYEGLAYGNLSLGDPAGFWVTASQRIDRTELHAEDLVYMPFEHDRGVALAVGSHPPSSEALTHAAVHRAAREAVPGIQLAVVHGHDADLWAQGDALGWSRTSPRAGNGSLLMASSVGSAVSAAPQGGALTMPGHQDGILLWGPDFTEIGARLDDACARLRATRNHDDA